MSRSLYSLSPCIGFHFSLRYSQRHSRWSFRKNAQLSSLGREGREGRVGGGRRREDRVGGKGEDRVGWRVVGGKMKLVESHQIIGFVTMVTFYTHVVKQ